MVLEMELLGVHYHNGRPICTEYLVKKKKRSSPCRTCASFQWSIAIVHGSTPYFPTAVNFPLTLLRTYSPEPGPAVAVAVAADIGRSVIDSIQFDSPAAGKKVY
jgi:hypothetical protein